MNMQEIRQKDNHTFIVKWEDGMEAEYRLSDLQKLCPCAGCVDETSGKRRQSDVDSNVKAVRIYNVGRYALRVQFTSGCSNGIYHLEMLYNIAKRK